MSLVALPPEPEAHHQNAPHPTFQPVPTLLVLSQAAGLLYIPMPAYGRQTGWLRARRCPYMYPSV
eukprot:scaffold333308_cov13-Prasinocladus_malaysianus.AAC.1